MWKIDIMIMANYLSFGLKKLRSMIKLVKQPATEHFPKEASELNKLAIKLKKEILKGNITTISTQEIDDATIPALNILRSQKYRD